MPSGDRVWRERGLRSAVLAGDERAWQVWYEETYPGLHAFVGWRCAGARDLAEEVLQETWLTAVRRIRSFDPDQGSFGDWLRGIAINVLRNQFRKRKPTQSLNGQLSAPGVSNEDRSEQIGRALNDLPERYEAVLRAKYLDQQSVAQISDAWGETPKAIESLLTRAREAFREAFRRLDEDH
jgi:RNA polymerase sigma-70 factor, ECF subfamily